jgi:hypothetical protein
MSCCSVYVDEKVEQRFDCARVRVRSDGGDEYDVLEVTGERFD